VPRRAGVDADGQGDGVAVLDAPGHGAELARTVVITEHVVVGETDASQVVH
jgi:hypothetical protein